MRLAQQPRGHTNMVIVCWIIDAHCPRLGISNEGDACIWEVVAYTCKSCIEIYLQGFCILLQEETKMKQLGKSEHFASLNEI